MMMLFSLVDHFRLKKDCPLVAIFFCRNISAHVVRVLISWYYILCKQEGVRSGATDYI